jgi:hypothetical protein
MADNGVRGAIETADDSPGFIQQDVEIEGTVRLNIGAVQNLFQLPVFCLRYSTNHFLMKSVGAYDANKLLRGLVSRCTCHDRRPLSHPHISKQQAANENVPCGLLSFAGGCSSREKQVRRNNSLSLAGNFGQRYGFSYLEVLRSKYS